MNKRIAITKVEGGFIVTLDSVNDRVCVDVASLHKIVDEAFGEVAPVKVEPKSTLDQIRDCLKAGNSLAACKVHRAACNSSLKDAKDFVEKVRHDMKLCSPAFCVTCKDESLKSQWNWDKQRNVQVWYLKNIWVGASTLPTFSNSTYYRATTMWVKGLDEAFNLLNNDGIRPRVPRSMSVGDVVEVGSQMWRCEGSGWKLISDEMPF